jgi:hypothetical protein
MIVTKAKQKSRQWSQSAGLQLPLERGANPSLKSNIRSNKNIVDNNKQLIICTLQIENFYMKPFVFNLVFNKKCHIILRIANTCLECHA